MQASCVRCGYRVDKGSNNALGCVLMRVFFIKLRIIAQHGLPWGRGDYTVLLNSWVPPPTLVVMKYSQDKISTCLNKPNEVSFESRHGNFGFFVHSSI